MSGFNLTSGRIGGTVLTYGDYPIQTSSAPALNQWHCIAIQRKTGLQELFWNGVLDASKAGTLSNTALTNPIVLGRAGSYNAFYSNCQIANLAIWNRSLIPSEIQTLYRLGPGWYRPYQKRSIGYAAAGFKAYWHRRQSQLIGGGLR